MKRFLTFGSALILGSLSLAVPSFAMGGFGVTNIPIVTSTTNFNQWANMSNVKLLTGDFNGDGRTDMVLLGSPQWASVPVAFSLGDGTFNVTNQPIGGNFAGYAAVSGVRALVGDFNGDHKADIALIGPPQWGFVPIAFSNGDGTFSVTLVSSTLTAWSNNNYSPAALVGDLNNDGKDDIVLTGPAAWGVVPVGFSNGDGSFTVTTQPNIFAYYASFANAKPLIGDFNGDGKADLALTGPSGWNTLPVAISNGDGTFNTTNTPISNFATWASTPGVKILSGDFNHDGKIDVALTGVSTWGSIPVALSNGDGSFAVHNAPLSDFPTWAADPSARILVGDFNGDGKVDVAITGPSGWASLPVAFSNGDGSFTVANQSILNFAGWASSSTPIVGDFNGDGKADVTLKVSADWTTLPVAFSLTPIHFF